MQVVWFHGVTRRKTQLTKNLVSFSHNDNAKPFKLIIHDSVYLNDYTVREITLNEIEFDYLRLDSEPEA